MCGICGYITRKVVSEDDLKRMNDTMYHRGPNDCGAEMSTISYGFTLGLAQRRLSIIDLSDLGHQPMHTKDKRISVVYNGEIYNYLELKKELSDYSFISTCDTEVIIAAYLKWGERFVEKLNGMFAIALFDRERDELILYRDRIGKKPLYYYSKDDTFVFGSELKPIMEFPYFKRNIDKRVLGSYLYHQYICGQQSIYQNVYRLNPGEYLVYKYGQIKRTKYWDISEKYHEGIKYENKEYGLAKNELKSLLIDSVKKRMIADVTVGTFLSGGYDSSLVTAIAQEVSDKPIKTFCIGFEQKEYNEAIYAKRIAEYLGTEHSELYIDKKDMIALVDSIPQFFDEPFADSSQIPTMLVSNLAKQKVTVVLSGDGGDELFCGYTRYENEPLAQKLDVIGSGIRAIVNLPGIRTIDIENQLPYRIRMIMKNKDPKSKTQYSYLNYIPIIKKIMGDKVDMIGPQYDESLYGENDWQKRAMLLDQETYLPNDILCKVDRATMKYSLEARCPILDYRIVEYSYMLPQKFKYYKGDKKHILKDIAYDYIPKHLLERPKQGFSVPIDEWMRGPLKERLIDYSNEEFLYKQGIFEPLYTSQYIKHYLVNGDGMQGRGVAHSRIIWSFLVFQMWLDRWK